MIQRTAPITLKAAKRRVLHVRDAGHERREGADDRHELRVDDRLAAVLLVERLRLQQVLALEKSRVRPVEDRRAGVPAQQVARSRCR